MRKRENKNYRFVPFLLDAEQKMPKKKQKKKKKIPLWHHSEPKQFGKGQERGKTKIIVSFRSYLSRYRKFQKNSKKIQKIKKNTIMASFQAKIVWKRPRKRENKNYRFASFLLDA